MKLNLWGSIKKVVAVFMIFTQVALPAAQAEVAPVEFQNQGIPAIAPDKVVETDSPEVPVSAFDAFFASSPLSEAVVSDQQDNDEPLVGNDPLPREPLSLEQPESDESKPFIGNDPEPLPLPTPNPLPLRDPFQQYPVNGLEGEGTELLGDDPVPVFPSLEITHYLVTGTATGADDIKTFSNLDDAKVFVNGTLLSLGINTKATFAEIGVMFETYGSAILVSYETTAEGIRVYLRNEVKTVKGDAVAVINWQDLGFGRHPVELPQEPITATPVFPVIGSIAPETAAKNELVVSLGLDAVQLEQWIAQGLVKTNVIRSFFGNFINVEFDVTIQGRHISRSELNPLGSFAVPAAVFMQFDERELPILFYPSRMVNLSPLPDGESWFEVPTAASIARMDIKFPYAIEMGEIDGASIFVQHAAVTYNSVGQVTNVTLRDGAFPEGAIVKEIAYSNLPGVCSIGSICMMAFNPNPKTATILYPQSQTITKREVVYNIADVLASEGMPYGSIRSIQDFTANGVVIESKFIYPGNALGHPCSVDATTGSVNCPLSQQHTQIERRNAATGILLSSIVLLETDPALNLSSSALITLANGKQRKVFYTTLEELLEKTAKIEPVQPAAVPHQTEALAELARVTGLSAADLQNQIRDIRFNAQTQELEILFNTGMMHAGRMIDPAGEFTQGALPERAIFKYEAIGMTNSMGGAQIYSLASAHWTWAKTAERLGKITAALTYDQVSSELRTIRWAEVVSTNGGWEALGENRILPADTYTYESEAIQIVR
nr:hypothetical protein [Candidatus Omnitrophota bacterium]